MTTVVLKDEHAQHLVASEWRPTLTRVLRALVHHDYRLISLGTENVEPVPERTALCIERSIAEYGESLVELPEDASATSASQWMGDHWAVLVDLFTRESGSSDLVLAMRISENDRGGYRYEVGSVYVP